MTDYTHLTRKREGPVEYLTLNRPELRNALNEALIADLTAWANAIREDSAVRVVVLAGAGPSFCAGADIEYMARTVDYTEERNMRDAMAVAWMYAGLNSLPLPMIGRVHGAAIGGGAGLAAVCDIVVAEEEAVFGFTEVKLGIIPAVISPFVLEKIGRSAARELFLTGARFSAARACEVGLVHAVVPGPALDDTVDRFVRELLGNGSEAMAAAKALITSVWAQPLETAMPMTAGAIATRRVSAEGQEGLTAFLQKRKPGWSRS